jgi:Uma2 family endonuclease
MATIPGSRAAREVDYPTSDGKPMGETDLHRQDMIDVIEVLEDYFAADPRVYVSGNLLLFYERGNRRKHISPDAFVVRGVPKLPRRDYYLLWEEGKAPDVAIEITSKTTRREDQKKKRGIYREILKVTEYFLFDPTRDYLRPPLQGFRLVEGEYMPIAPVRGRLPSEVLGLHLEKSAEQLRLFDPVTGGWLPTRFERTQQEMNARREVEFKNERTELALQRAEAALDRTEAARILAEAEIERLRLEIEILKRRLGETS